MSETRTQPDPNDVGRILVVDDDEKTCEFLARLIKTGGHRVSKAANGDDALALVEREAPDVVLMDVRMPGIDGIEVCRRIKSRPATAPIQVVLITGYDDRELRIEGIRAGARDFLAKPVDVDEVLVRMRNAVNTKHLFDRVQENYRRLQELEKMRETLTQMVVHDMRAPLTSIVMSLELMAVGGDDRQQQAERLAALRTAQGAARDLLEMANTMLDVSRMESGRMPLNLRTCSLSEVVRDAVYFLKPMLGRTRVAIDEPGTPLPVLCDGDIIRRVVVNLVGNAVKAMGFRETVDVTLRRDGESVRVLVSDSAPRIPPEYHGRLFERFGETEMPGRLAYSVGLGLPFCKLAVEAHGGTIGLSTDIGDGNTFWFVLPAGGPPPAVKT